MKNFDIVELSADEMESVSGGCDDHYDAGKALADSIQDAARKIKEWWDSL